eukprot:gene17299-biopygen2121
MEARLPLAASPPCDATRLAFLPPANESRMVAMRRGSIFVQLGIHPRWVRCDAARFPAAQIISHPVLKESLRVPKYLFPGHGVVVEMRRGAHRAPSKDNKERGRCDAGCTRHNWRKTRDGGDATRDFLCMRRG